MLNSQILHLEIQSYLEQIIISLHANANCFANEQHFKITFFFKVVKWK